MRYRRVAGAAAAAIGLVTLCGWWFGVAAFTRIVPGWPTMKPVTALLCVLSGAGVTLLGRGLPPRARLVGRLAAALATTLAVTTIVEHLLGVSVGLDRLLTGQPAGLPVGRTAVAFSFIGVGTLAIDWVIARRHSPAQLLALAAGSIASVALLGYAFGLRALYSPPISAASGGMAFHTAIAIVLLVSALLVARPDVGLVSALASEHAGGLVSRRLLLGLLAYAPVALFVLAGRHLGWYGDPGVPALLVFLALVEGALLIQITAVRLNAYDLRRKTSESLLRQSEQRIAQLIGLAPDGIFTADLEGRYTDVNEAGCRLLGLRREQIIGKTIVDLIPPEDVERLWRTRQEMLAGGVSDEEWSLRRGDGSYVPVEVTSKILPDGRWQGFVKDITERKRTEAALAVARETDRQLRAELERVTSAASSVSEAVAELPRPDISAVLQTIALQAQALTGARYVAVGLGTDPDRPFEPWVTLGMPAHVAEKIGRHPRPVGVLGHVVQARETVRVPDVSREPHFRGFPAHHPPMAGFMGVPIRYRDKVIGNLYLATQEGDAELSAQDQRMVEMLAARAAVAIETARLYAGEARQRAWLRNIFDQMPEGVIILDKAGRTVTTNHAVLNFACEDGDRLDAWGNATKFDLRQPDGAPVARVENPAVRALERGEASVSRELAMYKRPGVLVPVLAGAAPIRDDDGTVTGATIVVQDITALKELERLREEWASVIAHDLRQPVVAISLSAEALTRLSGPDVSERQRKALGHIQSAAARLRRMIEDLFDASRIEARRLSVKPGVVDLGALIGGVAEGLREAAGDHEIQVDARLGQYAWIDPDRIQQVLTNLIMNAAKYGEPGTDIVVRAATHEDVVEVAVTNQGAGIPAEEIPRLFSRFGRTPQAREAGTPGTGLGLYISKGLIEAHGGHIWVESTPGQSTTFFFVVTRAPVPAQPGADASPHLS